MGVGDLTDDRVFDRTDLVRDKTNNQGAFKRQDQDTHNSHTLKFP
jgi:hypothetical protein